MSLPSGAQSPLLKAVVFDCDGVMLSSKEANRAYYNHILATFQLPPMSETELDYVHSASPVESIQHVFRNHAVDLAEVDRYRQGLDYHQFLSYMVMEPDLIPFLKQIKPKCHTAISTNRMDTMATLLDTFELRPWFDKIVTAQDTPHPKPAPDALFMILSHFRIAAAETIFIGDSRVDEQHSRAAGVDLIAFRNPDLDARYHVDSFMEILDLPPFQLLLDQGAAV